MRQFEFDAESRSAARLTAAVWLTAFAIVAPPALLSGKADGMGEYLQMATGLLSAVGFSVLLYLAFRAVRPLHPLLAAAAMILACVGAAALQTVADFATQFLWKAIYADLDLPIVNAISYSMAMTFYLTVYALNTALFWIVRSNAHAREQAVLLTEARLEAARAQLAALRLQLNPHFMFNSLNAVLGLVTTDRKSEAEATLHKLAEFLRASLAADPVGQVPLDEELAAVRAYLDVEGVRFAGRLRLKVDRPKRLAEARVPDFLLQPLVENAVKYAVAPSARPVTIRVSGRKDGAQLVLTVEDDGPGAPAAGGSGVGLDNTRKRLQALYGAAASLHAARTTPGFRVEIRLPLQAAVCGGAAVPDRRAA